MKFCPQVEAHLKSGLGIFDIAVIMKCPHYEVRKHVSRLRKNGMLAFWWMPVVGQGDLFEDQDKG